MFDGSSISGWKGINESDMILMPDDSTAILDPSLTIQRSSCGVTLSNPPRCRAMTVTRAALPSGQKFF
ncbi:MAG: hypothetical protein CM15mP74_14980 [Halieaceae bacterium]|nr:MAG: hypothetical protein CM15mP74_14980 [Halieaceae bacterium]